MKFEGNILGKMRQQIGKSFVFTIWKGIQVAKQYAKPSNPRTPKQVTQRSKFSTIMILAQSYTTTMIDTYWRKFAIKMSAFNAFMQTNLLAFTNPADYSTLVFGKGSLYAQVVNSCTYDGITGAVICTFPAAPVSNQLATDNMQCVIVDIAGTKVYWNESYILRSAGTMTFTIPTGLEFARLACFLFAYRNLGESNEMISNNGYHVVAEP